MRQSQRAMTAAVTGARRGQQRLQVCCLCSRLKWGCTIYRGKACCWLFTLQIERWKAMKRLPMSMDSVVQQ